MATGTKVAKTKAKKPALQTVSLAVKYRPRKPSDFIGQGTALTNFIGGLKRGRISSSFMIVGPTGTGKTTLARLMSRMINCTDLGEDSTPCGECPNCKIDIEVHPDIHEMNFGASRGIDEIRALIQQSQNRPMMGFRRIFIVDEFHNATAAAQEALLKPLEEPPESTIWIIATTNPERIKETVTDRCTRVKLDFIDQESLAKRLRIIAKREGYDCAADKQLRAAVGKIAEYSNGILRNGIEMLDGVLNAKANDLDLTDDRILRKYVMSDDANLEEAAAYMLAGIIDRDVIPVLKAIRGTQGAIRQLVSKCRWLVDHLIEAQIGHPKFTPQSARVLATINKSHLKHPVSSLVKIQMILTVAEDKMNSLNIDDRIILESYVGSVIPSETDYLDVKKISTNASRK